MAWLIAAGLLAIVGWAVCAWLGWDSLLRKRGGALAGTARWEDQGATPLGGQGYTPQGLTWVDGRLIFANSWKNTKSRVYEIDPRSMAVQRSFDMPQEAVHTSGLAWDGKRLWAVDYLANRAYCIDLEASMAGGAVRVLGQFRTTLRGTSACCIVPWKGEACLAISDFMRSRRTIFVRMDDALRTGTADGNIAFDYANEGFSQGLECVDGCLFESENKAGVDIINKISLEKLGQCPSAYRATVAQYPAPSRGVEDLAWDGSAFWTTDETVFRFFRGTLDGALSPAAEAAGDA